MCYLAPFQGSPRENGKFHIFQVQKGQSFEVQNNQDMLAKCKLFFFWWVNVAAVVNQKADLSSHCIQVLISLASNHQLCSQIEGLSFTSLLSVFLREGKAPHYSLRKQRLTSPTSPYSFSSAQATFPGIHSLDKTLGRSHSIHEDRKGRKKQNQQLQLLCS